MPDRAAILRSLVKYQLPIEQTVRQLHQFSWDSDEPHAVLKCSDLLNILERFLQQELTAEEVHNWAELLECREDISYLENEEQCLSKIILHLANSDLWGKLSKKVAQEICIQLHSS